MTERETPLLRLTEGHKQVLKFLSRQEKQRAKLEVIVDACSPGRFSLSRCWVYVLVRWGYVRRIWRGIYELAPRGRRYLEGR